MAKREEMRAEVIVLGAGAAGLAAAEALAQRGVRTLVLEGRDRVGGRLLTIADAKTPIPVELGAEFVHGSPRVTWEMLRRFGIVAFDLPFEHWELLRGKLRTADDFDKQLERGLGGLSRLKRDMSFAEYLRTHRAGRALADAREAAAHFVEGFDAADTERVSAKSVAAEQEGLGDFDNETQFRLRDGYITLVDALRRSSELGGLVHFRLGRTAWRIRWSRGSVEVVCEHGSREEIFRAAKLIVTLPVGVLHVPPEQPGAVRFEPEIADKRAALDKLASGPVFKAVITFTSAFWEDPEVAVRAGVSGGARLRDASFLHAPRAPIPTWWTMRPLRVPVLTAWAGGPSALALAGLDEAGIRRAVGASLGPLFSISPAKVRGMIARVHHHDWINDPFSLGAYSYELVGAGSARAKLAKPLAGTLFFAGEATDAFGQASTVAGALASGRRAAMEVARSVKRAKR